MSGGNAPSMSASAAAGHVGGDGTELHGVLRRLGPRFRGHRPHPRPPRLPGSSSSSDPDRKRASTSDPDRRLGLSSLPQPCRARVVGWPPVRSFRKNALSAAAASKAKFVKVAVDGAPYLRKVDQEAYAGYDQLLAALQDKFFSHFTVRKVGNDEMELVDAVSGTEYVPTYEDKDGDWMLVGDVPWIEERRDCQ